jgi:hypothetical protein
LLNYFKSGEKLTLSSWSSLKHNPIFSSHFSSTASQDLQITSKRFKKEHLKKTVHVNRVLNNNLMIAKMLITISASFVVLNLPYLIAYTVHALHFLNNSDSELLGYLYEIVKLTRILNLLNYSIAGLLYFASGEVFRVHLYAILGCNRMANRRRYTSYTF